MFSLDLEFNPLILISQIFIAWNVRRVSKTTEKIQRHKWLKQLMENLNSTCLFVSFVINILFLLQFISRTWVHSPHVQIADLFLQEGCYGLPLWFLFSAAPMSFKGVLWMALHLQRRKQKREKVNNNTCGINLCTEQKFSFEKEYPFEIRWIQPNNQN